MLYIAKEAVACEWESC